MIKDLIKIKKEKKKGERTFIKKNKKINSILENNELIHCKRIKKRKRINRIFKRVQGEK